MANDVSVGLVSLICLPLAALLLLAPLHRLILPMLPVPIEEHRYSDGTIRLLQTISPQDQQGVLRSRPLSAALLELNTGQSLLGYVVAIRPGLPDQAELDSGPDADVAAIRLPQRPHWRTDDLASADLPCRLAVSQPGQPPHWLPCDAVVRVVMPNRLSPLQKLEVALARLAKNPFQNREDRPPADEPQPRAGQRPEPSG